MTDLREQLAAIVYDPTNGTAATDKALATAQDLINSGLVPQWQPIDTAPTDGCRFLALRPERGITEACLPDGCGCGEWNFDGVVWSGVANAMDATHWMPIPAAPGVQGGEA